MKFIIILFVLNCLWKQLEAFKILAVIPTPSYSHQVPLRPIFMELVKRGHDVTVITTDPAYPKSKSPPNLIEVNVSDSYKMWRKEFLKVAHGNQNQVIAFAITLLNRVVEKQLHHSEVKTILDGDERFDLLLLESWSKILLSFSHKYKVPVILMSSYGAVFGNYDIVGAPTHPLNYQTLYRQRVYNLTFLEKLDEIYKYYWRKNFHYTIEPEENTAMRKYFGNDMPTISELSNNVDMLLVNFHHIFEGNNPVPLGVSRIWGIHKRPENVIPEDLKSYLDSSKHGVIYMSFGTNTDPANLPSETIRMILKVLSDKSYDVLFKWNYDELPGKPENFRIAKWFPQSDLLRHPKIKLFISQGGLQSTDEAINAEVPLVGIPMIGDQWHNVEKYVHFGIGIKLLVEELSEANFKLAIETVINNDSYRRNIKQLRDLMNDEPVSALERAVWWVEYVLSHGGARHLRAPAANMPWTQYYEIELLLSLSFVILAITYVATLGVKFVFSYAR